MATKKPSLTTALANVCRELDDLGVKYALVGGLAVSARAEPRLTRDVDLAVAVPDDATAEQVVRSLVGRRYQLVSMVEQTNAGRLATVRLTPPGRSELLVDLPFASCGIEPEIVEHSEAIAILPRLTVRVARIGHLIAMKLLARDDRKRP